MQMNIFETYAKLSTEIQVAFDTISIEESVASILLKNYQPFSNVILSLTVLSIVMNALRKYNPNLIFISFIL